MLSWPQGGPSFTLPPHLLPSPVFPLCTQLHWLFCSLSYIPHLLLPCNFKTVFWNTLPPNIPKAFVKVSGQSTSKWPFPITPSDHFPAYLPLTYYFVMQQPVCIFFMAPSMIFVVYFFVFCPPSPECKPMREDPCLSDMNVNSSEKLQLLAKATAGPD